MNSLMRWLRRLPGRATARRSGGQPVLHQAVPSPDLDDVAIEDEYDLESKMRRGYQDKAMWPARDYEDKEMPRG